MRTVNRILWNVRDEDIDEIVINKPAMVHIEQMHDRCWWIGIYLDDKPDGPYWMGNFVCDSRGRMRFVEQEKAGVEWEKDASHDEWRPAANAAHDAQDAQDATDGDGHG